MRTQSYGCPTRATVGAVVVLLLLAGCSGDGAGSQSSHLAEGTQEPSSEDQASDIGLENLLPTHDELTFPSGAIVASDAAQPATGTEPNGALTGEFGPRACDNVHIPPYWPAVLESTQRSYRDSAGEQTISVAVTRLASSDDGEAVIGRYADLLAFCEAHASEDSYGVEETLLVDADQGTYGVRFSDSEDEVVNSAQDEYFIHVSVHAPASHDDAVALMREIRARISD